MIPPDGWTPRANGYDQFLKRKIPYPLVQERYLVSDGCLKQYVGREGKKGRKKKTKRKMITVQAFKEMCNSSE